MLVLRLSEELVTPQAKEHWLAYWKHFSRDSHAHCSAHNCKNAQEQAIFVAHPKNKDDDVFVIPLCKEHSNAQTDQIEIHDDIELVPFDLTL